METINTEGIICIFDGDFIYKVAIVSYYADESGYYRYTFTPNYSVIDMMPRILFKGIPGLDLEQRKESYVRENIVPCFISERSPSPNRDDLYELLSEVGMNSLNRLEWLKRTDTHYSGDKMIVRDVNTVGGYRNTIIVDSMYDLVKRSDSICKELLKIVCAGDNLECMEISINDNNRKDYYRLLSAMYKKNMENRKIAQREGIRLATEKDVYKGRKEIPLDNIHLDLVLDDYVNHRKTSNQAAEELGISESTFFRRLRNAKK